MIAGVDGFGDELRVAGEALVAALGGKSGRFIAQNDDDLIFHIDAGVVVVAKFVGGGAITDKDEVGRSIAGLGIAKGDVVLIELEIGLGIAVVNSQMIRTGQLGAGSNNEGLQVALFSGGLKAETFITVGNHVFGAGKALRAVATAFHFRGCESFDVSNIALGTGRSDLRGGGSRKGKRESKSKGENTAAKETLSHHAESLKGMLVPDNEFSHAMWCESGCQFNGRATMNETTGAKLPEPWLRGTLREINPVIRAVLHALELAKEDLWKWCSPLTLEQLNKAAGKAAPVAFHLRHIARSMDRLLTYAEGAQLNERQMAELRSEMEPADSQEVVFEELLNALENSKKRLIALQTVDFAAERAVGKRRLPTTVAGLAVHIADHTQRHVGQAITTAKIVTEQ